MVQTVQHIKMKTQTKTEVKGRKITMNRYLLATALLTVTFMFVLIPQLTTVNAFEDLGNGTYILTASEYTSLTDQQIADYMVSTFQIHSVDMTIDSIVIYYNLVYVEPTHVNNTVRVFNYQYPTYIPVDLLNQCLELTSNNYVTCVNVLVNAPEPVTYDLGNNETVTITSTYAQALEQGIDKYNSAIELRDSLENIATMEEFISNI